MSGLFITLFCFANVAFASAKTNSLEYIVRSGIVHEKGEAQLCVMETLIRQDGTPRGRRLRFFLRNHNKDLRMLKKNVFRAETNA